jgi:hypothetical protein
MGISSSLGSSALLPAGLGFRNLLINGDFGINQRGFTSNSGNIYGFDRWLTLVNTGTVTHSSQSFSLGNAIPGQEPKNYARLVTSGQSASNAYAFFVQKIESVRTLAGKTATISFWAKTGSGTPKISVEFEQVFGTGGSPSSVVATYCGQVTVSTSWTRYSLTVNVPSIFGKTVGTTDDGSINLNIWVSGGSDFNSRTGSIGIQNGTFDIWGVQVEQNYQPTPFEQRPIGVELALCQRYYEKSYDLGTAPATVTETGVHRHSGSGNASGRHYVPIRFKVEKRANDYTVTTYDPTTAGSTWVTQNPSQAGLQRTPLVENKGTSGMVLNVEDGGYSWNVGNTRGHWSASSEL